MTTEQAGAIFLVTFLTGVIGVSLGVWLGRRLERQKRQVNLKQISHAYYQMAKSAIEQGSDPKWIAGYRAGFEACYRRVEQAMKGDEEP